MLTSFGAGRLYGVRTDIANASPLEFAALQSVDLSFSFTTKELYGSNQFALLVARGQAKWTATAKTGAISAHAFNDIFLGQSVATGQLASAMGEAGAVPAETDYEVTVENSATFVADYGVVYAATGQRFTKVATGPIAGQYSVAAGVYTFAAADAGAAVLLSYTYTIAGTGSKIAITNQLDGTTPFFSAVFRNRDPNSGLFSTYVFNRVTSTALKVSSKMSDWTIPEFDMEIMDDGTGNIGTLSTGDAA